MTQTQLTNKQEKHITTPHTENGKKYFMRLVIRHDDRHNNGHNTFSITYEEYENKLTPNRMVGCGHHAPTIAQFFPAFAYLCKYHLCSTDGPLYYVPNTLYHVQHGNYDHARNTAIWPDATDEQLSQPEKQLKQALMDRLPSLMVEFQAAVESLGFTY